MPEYSEIGPSALESHYSSGFIPDAELLVDSAPADGKVGFGVWPVDISADDCNTVHLTRNQVKSLVEHLTTLLYEKPWS
jgi:hypothetical protein